LETRRPVDLLKERSTDALAKWLKAHPGVIIISRDRSNEYAKGASIGAQETIQVADRFHLVKNLREALELFLEQNRHCLRAAGELNPQTSSPTIHNSSVVDKPFPTGQKEQSLTKAEKKRQLIRQKRLERCQEVVDLDVRGIKIRTIARQLGLHRSTVRKIYKLVSFLRWQKDPRRLSSLILIWTIWKRDGRLDVEIACNSGGKSVSEVLMVLTSWFMPGVSRKVSRNKIPTKFPTQGFQKRISKYRE
jgi:transposase